MRTILRGASAIRWGLYWGDRLRSGEDHTEEIVCDQVRITLSGSSAIRWGLLWTDRLRSGEDYTEGIVFDHVRTTLWGSSAIKWGLNWGDCQRYGRHSTRVLKRKCNKKTKKCISPFSRKCLLLFSLIISTWRAHLLHVLHVFSRFFSKIVPLVHMLALQKSFAFLQLSFTYIFARFSPTL